MDVLKLNLQWMVVVCAALSMQGANLVGMSTFEHTCRIIPGDEGDALDLRRIIALLFKIMFGSLSLKPL